MAYNRVLTDEDREAYKKDIADMYKFIPEMSSNKIAGAMVQEAFVYNMATHLAPTEHPMILSAGSYQDTAAELLRYYGHCVYDVDPVINCDLHTFRMRTNNRYDVIISTSVLEHTQHDEEFISDICHLLVPGGYAILTCDFKDDWIPGQPVPYTSNRFYTSHDLRARLRDILIPFDCDLIDEPDYSARDTFIWDGINYSFATFVFKKGR